LPDFLQSLAAQAQEHFPEVVLDLHPIPDLPPTTAHHLRMMSREAVTNAIKHSAAHRLTLHLSCQGEADRHLILRISDNGQGFQPDFRSPTVRSGHFGCTGIRERCRSLGAEAVWQSQPGQGTTLTITLPLAAGADTKRIP
jgi:signal transduction histidine kinase